MRPRLRFSSFALAAALLCALGGLFAFDKIMADRKVLQKSRGAVEAAVLLEGLLRSHAQTLQAARALFLDSGHPPAPADFAALMSPDGRAGAAFRRVILADTSGLVLFRIRFDGTDTITGPVDLDTLTRFDMRHVMRAARERHHTELSHPGTLFSGERGIVIVEPLFAGGRPDDGRAGEPRGRFSGFAVGTIASQRLLDTLTRRARAMHGTEARGASPLRYLVLDGDGDTVVKSGGPSSLWAHGAVSVALAAPDDATWHVFATLPPIGRPGERFALWAVGLLLLGALLLALLHERRQGVRLAERSSELERLSVELLRANRAKSEFLANVSHELRTPLNAIVGFVDLLRDGVYGPLGPRQVNPVERVAASATHLRHLVDQILDIAKIAAGRLEVHAEPLDLHALVHDVTSEMESLTSDRELTLSVSVGSELPRVRTDPTHLRQILLNLVGNAINYTPRGGIAVRARAVRDPDAPRHAGSQSVGDGRPDRAWVALEVADSGIGIARQDHERIFEEFEQVGAGPRGASMERGTGLGLAISRRLARLLGGDITLESELGKGSTFTVWLPVEET